MKVKKIKDKRLKQPISEQLSLLFNRFFGVFSFILFLLALLLGYFLVIHKPFQSLAQAYTVKLPKLDENIKKLEKATASMEKYVDSSVEFTPAEEYLISLAVPNHFDFSSIIVQLNQMANQNGFMVGSLEKNDLRAEPEVVVKDKRLKKANLSLQLVGGDYNRLKEFISDLESSIMIFDLVSVNFDTEVDGQYNLNLISYYYDQ